jgi:hypothetical protein
LLVAGYSFLIKGDDFLKSRLNPIYVIPVPHQARDRLQPESRNFNQLKNPWTPVFTGVTISYEAIKSKVLVF